MRQSVVHLASTLRVSNIENLVFAGGLLDHSDVCSIIVHSHVGPGPVPVLSVIYRKSLVIPTVLSTSVAADPNIIACINQLKMEWDLALIGEILNPGSTVFFETMLE